MRKMHDSITAADIPADAQMVAGYVNGTFQWSPGDWARFPNAVKVRIATQAYVNDGHVLDIEQGDATPGQAPGWVAMRRAAGVDPTAYCNASTWPLVRAAFQNQGIPEPHYWIAQYDNVASVPAGAVAKQYIDPPTSGGHYDLSAVLENWPGVDSGTPTPTPVNPSGVEIMERKALDPSPSTTSTRLLLSGSPGAAIIIRPKGSPVWIGHIFAWGSDKTGIGHDPKNDPNNNPKVVDARRYDLPGALWCDLEYSAASAFDIDIVG